MEVVLGLAHYHEVMDFLIFARLGAGDGQMLFEDATGV